MDYLLHFRQLFYQLRVNGGINLTRQHLFFFCHSLFSYNCYYQLSCTTEIPVLAKVDTLPGAEIQTAIGDRDGDADTAKCRFGMSRHIVSPLQRMLVLRAVLRNQTVEDGFHIHANIRITVLVDAQSTTGVLRKDVHDAGLRKFRQLAHNLARHQMEAATFRLQGYFNLLYHLTKLSTILLDT